MNIGNKTRTSFFIADLNVTDGYKSKKSNETNNFTHFFQILI